MNMWLRRKSSSCDINFVTSIWIHYEIGCYRNCVVVRVSVPWHADETETNEFVDCKSIPDGLNHIISCINLMEIKNYR